MGKPRIDPLCISLPLLLVLVACAPGPGTTAIAENPTATFSPQAAPPTATTEPTPTSGPAATQPPPTQPLDPSITPTMVSSDPIEPVGTIDLYHLPTSEPLSPANAESIVRLGQYPGTLSFSPDMRHAEWIIEDEIKVISIAEPLTLAELPEYSVVAFAPDGSRVAWEMGTGTVTVRNLRSSAPDIVLEGISPGWGVMLAFSPNPRYLLVRDAHPDDEYGAKLLLRFWDIDAKDAPVTWEAYEWGKFSPSGAQIGFKMAGVVGASVWDVEQRTERGTVQGFEMAGPEYGLMFSPDWNSAAFWGRASGEVYSLSTGAYRFTFEGQARQFSPDGTLLATAEVGWVNSECSSAACLYDSYSGELVKALRHSSTVNSMDFSPDGRLFATVDSDGVHLWDVATWAELPRVESEALAVTRVGFSPDGHYLLGYGYAQNGSGEMVEFWAALPES